MDREVTFGDRLRLLRAGRDWSQAVLARRSGLSKPTLSNIESGKTEARDTTIAALSTALGVSRDALEDDVACLDALEQLVGVERPPPPSSRHADVPAEVAELLAQVPPERREAFVLMLRGMVATFGTPADVTPSRPRGSRVDPLTGLAVHGTVVPSPRIHGSQPPRPSHPRPPPGRPGGGGQDDNDGRK